LKDVQVKVPATRPAATQPQQITAQ
jgi:hypothetical protein